MLAHALPSCLECLLLLSCPFAFEKEHLLQSASSQEGPLSSRIQRALLCSIDPALITLVFAEFLFSKELGNVNVLAAASYSVRCSGIQFLVHGISMNLSLSAYIFCLHLLGVFQYGASSEVGRFLLWFQAPLHMFDTTVSKWYQWCQVLLLYLLFFLQSVWSFLSVLVFCQLFSLMWLYTF